MSSAEILIIPTMSAILNLDALLMVEEEPSYGGISELQIHLIPLQNESQGMHSVTLHGCFLLTSVVELLVFVMQACVGLAIMTMLMALQPVKDQGLFLFGLNSVVPVVGSSVMVLHAMTENRYKN